MAIADYQLQVAEAQCEAPRTIRERITSRKESLERQLANVNAALAAMDASPDFEKIHDAITKAGY